MVVIGLAGLSTTGVIVHLDTAMSEFDAVSFLLQDLDDPGATKVMHLTSWWVAEDVYGMQNATPYLRHDSRAGTGRVLLAISGERLDYFMQSGERCGDPATEADPNYCRVSYNVLDTYNGSTLIREFGRAGITDALPQLPYSIEKRLTNPWMVLERHPARQGPRSGSGGWVLRSGGRPGDAAVPAGLRPCGSCQAVSGPHRIRPRPAVDCIRGGMTRTPTTGRPLISACILTQGQGGPTRKTAASRTGAGRPGSLIPARTGDAA